MTQRRHRYTIKYRRAALRDLARLPMNQRRNAVNRIDPLEVEPRPRGSILLEGRRRGDQYYRIRSGQNRIIYRIDDKPTRVVTIARVRPRGGAYGGL